MTMPTVNSNKLLIVLLSAALLSCSAVHLVDALGSDSRLFVTLSILKDDGAPYPFACGDNASNTGFMLDVSAITSSCNRNWTTRIFAIPFNGSLCEFVLDPGVMSDAMVPCFDGIMHAPALSWTSLRAALNSTGPVNISMVRMTIGNFEHSEDSSGSNYTAGLAVILVVFVVVSAFHTLDALHIVNVKFWSVQCAQVVSCFVIYAAVLCGILLYLSISLYQPTPYISVSYPLTVESCYVTLRDVAPWNIGYITDTITMNDAPLRFTSISSAVADQWPCTTQVFHNPYHVVFNYDGSRVPLSVTLTGSTLIVASGLNATYVPLVISSTAHQLKANRVYLQNASFYSISVSLFSGIAYLSNSVTDPSQKIELNTTSVIVSTGEAQNPKALTIRHTSNPPLFCLGPDVAVDYNASQCSGGPETADTTGAIPAGGNESFNGYTGYCTLSASDTFPNLNSSVILGRVQSVHIRCASVYALPTTTKPIYNKTIGLGFSHPPEISDAIRGALNVSAWATSSGMYTDYVQSVEIVTPLLGAQMLNTNNPSVLEFFPELMIWLTGFVLRPPYRTLQVVPNHFTCSNEFSIANIIPPEATLITYLRNYDLTEVDERFVNGILYPIFSQVSQYPEGGLTSYQLPFEAANVFPGVQRNTFDDGVSVAIQRPGIADFLIFLSSVLSFLLVGGISVILWISWDKLYDYMTLKQKRILTQSTQKHLRARAHANTTAAPAVTSPPLTSSPSTEPIATPTQNPVSWYVRISDPAESIVRIINGFSYRIVCKMVRLIQSVYTQDNSFDDFVNEYCEFNPASTSENISVEDFSLYYRSFCRIFDRADQRTYRSEKDLLHKLSKIFNSNKVQIRWGKLVGVSWKGVDKSSFERLCGNASSEEPTTLFGKHVDQVMDMFNLNNVGFAFICWRCTSGCKWYDRWIRHPFAINNAQSFVYCFVFLIPIWFAMFSLFSLQMAMTPYQIYGVNFRTSESEAAFLPTPQEHATMQIVLLWAAYITLGCVAFERLLHSVMQLMPNVFIHGGKEQPHTVLPVLKFIFRFTLSTVYFLCCLYSIGYVFLVCLWWILTCFLAPNVMIPFAASAISFITSLFGIYKSLRSCKTKLIEILKALITKEVAKFLGSIQVVVGDDGMTITTQGGDRKKEIASVSKIPLEIVEFAIQPEAQKATKNDLANDTKLAAISVLMPSGSPEFVSLMNAFSNPTGDVDDPTAALQPYLDLAPDVDDLSKTLVVDSIRSLLSASSKTDPSGIDMEQLRCAMIQKWKTEVLSSIQAAQAGGKMLSQSTTKLCGVQRVIDIASSFLQRRRLDSLCRSLTQILYPLSDAFPSPSFAEWQSFLPIVDKLTWLLSDSSPYTPSLAAFEMCFPLTKNCDEIQKRVQDFVVRKLKAIRDSSAMIEGSSSATKPPPTKTPPTKKFKQFRSDIWVPLVSQEMKTTGYVPTSLQPNKAPLETDDTDINQVIRSLEPVRYVTSAWTIDVDSLENSKQQKKELKTLPLTRRWVYCLLLGREWPSLDFTVFLPMISSSDFRTITTYSLAGINPTSFTELTNWVSSSHPSIRKRELVAAAAIVNKCNNFVEAKKYLKFASEAWYYAMVKDPKLDRSSVSSGSGLAVLQQCLAVSCPLMVAWIIAEKKSTVSWSSIDAFFKEHDMFERLFADMNAPPLANADVALTQCQAHRTPLHLLALAKSGKLTPVIVDEVRRATGVQLWMTSNNNVTTTSNVEDEVLKQKAALVETVCAASVMQSALSWKGKTIHPVWKTLSSLCTMRDPAAASDERSTDDTLQDEDFLLPNSASFPLCRLIVSSDVKPTDSVEPAAVRKAAFMSTVAASYRRSEPMYASLAVAMWIDSSPPNDDKSRAKTNSSPDPATSIWNICQRLSRRILSNVTQASDVDIKDAASLKLFFNTPSFLLKELLREPSLAATRSTVLGRIQIALAMFDTVGEWLSTSTPTTNTKSLTEFTRRNTMSYNGLSEVIQIIAANDPMASTRNPTNATVNTNAANGVAILRCILACTTSSDVEPSMVQTAMDAIVNVFECDQVSLVPDCYRDATLYLTRKDRDTYGTIIHGILPILSGFSEACMLHAKQCSYLVAHAVKLHHHKRRGPSLLEIFRTTIVRSLDIKRRGPLVMDATPVDEWGASLQDYAATKDMSKLKKACTVAGLQGTSDSGWMMLQRFVEASSSDTSKWSSAMSSAFTANLKTIPAQEIHKVLHKLKKAPIFAPLADSLQEQLSNTTTLESLSEKLVEALHNAILEQLHLTESDIAGILAYVGFLLGGLVTFVLTGILAFSNGSTFSSVIGVAFPAAGGSLSQYDTSTLLETLKEKAQESLQELAHGAESHVDNTVANIKMKID